MSMSNNYGALDAIPTVPKVPGTAEPGVYRVYLKPGIKAVQIITVNGALSTKLYDLLCEEIGAERVTMRFIHGPSVPEGKTFYSYIFKKAGYVPHELTY